MSELSTEPTNPPGVDNPLPAPRGAPGRLALGAGLALAVLGVVAYVVQVRANLLFAPWYMPVLAVIGVALVVLSLRRARSVWRFLALLFVTLLLGAEGVFLFGLNLPRYGGPVAVGRPFPVFSTTRADGTAFTERDLQGDKTSVLVFFRGRW
jgi:hypothetical protein